MVRQQQHLLQCEVKSSSALATKILVKEMPRQIPLDLVPLHDPLVTLVDSRERNEIQAILHPALALDSPHRPRQGIYFTSFRKASVLCKCLSIEHKIQTYILFLLLKATKESGLRR